MKKSTKGAIAAAAAAVLLLGGGTTLAYWTASVDIAGGTITAGELKLTPGTCTDWTYAGGTANSGTVTNWVPGDVVTKSCDYTIVAKGDNLAAKLTAPATLTLNGTAPATGQATVDTTYTVGTAAIVDGELVTDGDDGKKLTATFKVTFPYGDATAINANATQSWAATLNNLNVTLTQQNPNP